MRRGCRWGLWSPLVASLSPLLRRLASTVPTQVPAALAYGEKGVQITNKDGTTEYLVPPNEKLQFEITLLQVAVPPP